MNKYNAKDIPIKSTSSRILVKLIKIKEVDNPKHPNNIPEGYIIEEYIDRAFFIKPTVGERFYISMGWSTSPVREIINENTFKTYNSIYKWEII